MTHIPTCSYSCDRSECVRAQRDELVRRAERDAAEIVRLRGEVCSCPSGDGSLRWPCKAHPPEPIAPAEAKGDEEVPCSTHPDAPHGFDRNGSHNADRYVCECEGWQPPAPQPAGGDAVAPHGRIRWLDGDFEIEWLREWTGGDCDLYLAAHPSACELGAVRAAAESMRSLAAVIRQHGTCAPAALECVADNIVTALQHRGDSRGGEG